ncbi:hypothetical protein F5Y13DRAFT_199041 [Hypoxylon sp. FL1857]|nr:hypothetical protein F5Y13DRAFT_199041 [Hypoxylon sp. FL1857]
MASDDSDSLPWGRPRVPLSSSESSRSIAKHSRETRTSLPSTGLVLLTRFAQVVTSRRLRVYHVHGREAYLGSGTTYQVSKRVAFKSLDKQEKGIYVAVKTAKVETGGDVYDLSISREECRTLNSVLFELEILSHAAVRQHTNIASLLGYSWDVHDGAIAPSLIMELATLGNARSFLSSQSLPDKQKVNLCSDVASGLYFLHTHNIIHGDVKLDNILIYEDAQKPFVAKISDFERSPQNTEGLVYIGTTLYNAPEVQKATMSRNSNFLPRDQLWLCDIFSFGLLAVEVFFGVRFYGDLSNGSRIKELVRLGSDSRNEILRLVTDMLRRFWKFSRSLQEVCSQVVHLTLQASPLDRLPGGWRALHETLQLDPKINAALRAETGTLVNSRFCSSYSILEICMSSRQIGPSIATKLWAELRSIVDTSAVKDDQGKAFFNLFLMYAVIKNGFKLFTNASQGLDYITRAASAGYAPAYIVGKRVFQANHTPVPDILHRGPQNGTLRKMLSELDRSPNEKFYPTAVQLFWPMKLQKDATNHLNHLSPLNHVGDLPTWIHEQHQVMGKNYFLEYAESHFLLHRAVVSGSFRAYEMLIKLGSDVDLQMPDGVTPLHLACQCAEADLIELFLKRGANPSLTDIAHTSPLHWLVLLPEEDIRPIGSLLLKSCRDNRSLVTSSSRVFFDDLGLVADGTPLHWAISCRNLAVVDLLLRLVPEHLLNKPYTISDYLDRAVATVSADTTTYLLQYGGPRGAIDAKTRLWFLDALNGDAFTSDFQRWIMHGSSIERSYRDTIEAIVNFNVSSSAVFGRPKKPSKPLVSSHYLYRAAIAHNIPMIKELLRYGADANAVFDHDQVYDPAHVPRHSDPDTALGWAISSCHSLGQVHREYETIQFLLAQGGTTYKISPIVQAVTADASLDVIRLLISAKPNSINVRFRGMVPLHHCLKAKRGFPVFKMMVESGADLYTEDGETISAEIEKDRRAKLRYMNSGRTALAWAVYSLDWKIIQYLLDHQAPLDFGTAHKQRQSVLHLLLYRAFGIASKNTPGELEKSMFIARNLLSHRAVIKADLINRSNYDEWTPFSMAIVLGLPFLLDTFIKHQGGIPDEVQSWGLQFCRKFASRGELPPMVEIKDNEVFLWGDIYRSFTLPFREYKEGIAKVETILESSSKVAGISKMMESTRIGHRRY